MILVGEAHPELPLDSMIASLGLSAHVRHIGFAPIEDFNGYLSACDIVLNLRYPDCRRKLRHAAARAGMGSAVIVSDVGSFREYPDEICLKAPVDATEEDHLFEYLNLLVSRPELARAMGARAREWVERECNWESVAQRYAEFLEAVVEESRVAGSSQAPPVRVGVDEDEHGTARVPETAGGGRWRLHRIVGPRRRRVARLRRNPS